MKAEHLNTVQFLLWGQSTSVLWGDLKFVKRKKSPRNAKKEFPLHYTLYVPRGSGTESLPGQDATPPGSALLWQASCASIALPLAVREPQSQRCNRRVTYSETNPTKCYRWETRILQLPIMSIDNSLVDFVERHICYLPEASIVIHWKLTFELHFSFTCLHLEEVLWEAFLGKAAYRLGGQLGCGF